MDLWNAKLLRIDKPGPIDAMGRKTIVEGDSINVTCVLGGVSESTSRTLGAELADADAELIVISAALPPGLTPAAGDRMLAQPWDRAADGGRGAAVGPAVLYDVRRVTVMAGDHLTHYQCVLRTSR